jgi:hypothetical protein
MSDPHDDNGIKYEFKHDTDNLTLFAILSFSVAATTLIVALTLVWLRFAKEEIADAEAKKPYTAQLYFEGEEDNGLKGIEDAKKAVVKAYNK